MKRIILAIALFCYGATAEAQFTERKRICVSPTVTAGAYSAFDNIGGKLTFSSVLRSELQSGVITAAYVYDKASQNVAYELHLFREDPTATTFTDNSALDIADADLSKSLTPISFTTGDRFAYADNSHSARQAQYIPVTFPRAASHTLYGSLRSSGTPTYAATTDITVCIVVEGD